MIVGCFRLSSHSSYNHGTFKKPATCRATSGHVKPFYSRHPVPIWKNWWVYSFTLAVSKLFIMAFTMYWPSGQSNKSAYLSMVSDKTRNKKRLFFISGIERLKNLNNCRTVCISSGTYSRTRFKQGQLVGNRMRPDRVFILVCFGSHS